MIVVHAQLTSAIDESRDRSLCLVEIDNDGMAASAARGNYRVRLYGASTSGARGRLIRTARVENHPRNALPAWRLIAAAFDALELGPDAR